MLVPEQNKSHVVNALEVVAWCEKRVSINYHSILKRFLSIFCIICAFLIPQIDLLQVEQLQILAKIESR